MTVFIKDAPATANMNMNTNIESQKRMKRTGAELFENDGERGCRCALVGEIWVVPGNCGENGEHVNDQKDQSTGSAHRSNRLVGYLRGRKEEYCRMRQLKGERSL